jgi:hypothetical protein
MNPMNRENFKIIFLLNLKKIKIIEGIIIMNNPL